MATLPWRALMNHDISPTYNFLKQDKIKHFWTQTWDFPLLFPGGTTRRSFAPSKDLDNLENQNSSSCWFQSIWKICLSNCIISTSKGEKLKDIWKHHLVKSLYFDRQLTIKPRGIDTEKSSPQFADRQTGLDLETVKKWVGHLCSKWKFNQCSTWSWAKRSLDWHDWWMPKGCKKNTFLISKKKRNKQYQFSGKCYQGRLHYKELS